MDSVHASADSTQTSGSGDDRVSPKGSASARSDARAHGFSMKAMLGWT
jgi:hypothetical protein